LRKVVEERKKKKDVTLESGPPVREVERKYMLTKRQLSVSI